MGQTPARGRHRARRLGLKESFPEGVLAHQTATQPPDPASALSEFPLQHVTARTARTVLEARRRCGKRTPLPNRHRVLLCERRLAIDDNRQPCFSRVPGLELVRRAVAVLTL